MSQKTDYDIFLSYSNKDKSWVSEFVLALKEAGVKSWFDIHELMPGERWDDKLQQALRESNIIVVIISEKDCELINLDISTFSNIDFQKLNRSTFSTYLIHVPNSIDSPWTFFELGAAIADKKRIIPVLIGDIESRRIPVLLRRFQFLKEASPAEAGKRIAQAIEKTTIPKAQPAEV